MPAINKANLLAGASIAILSICSTANAGALPGHGHFAAGQGAITRHGGRMTVDQSSATGIIDWRNFSVGKANSISFDSGHGATLNIVHGGDLSRIAGALHGTGSVYLINRAGVVVSGNGRVDTQGSFIASGRNADSFSGARRMTLAGSNRGRVVNRGEIQSVNGRVGLFGHNVINSGSISGRGAVVVASARVRVAGNIAASHGVETSGGRIALSGAAIIARNWLIDPKNLTVTASAAKSIGKSLGKGTNVTLKTTKKTASGPGKTSKGPGDIVVNAPITWSSTAKLTLKAYHQVIVNRAVHAKGKATLEIDDGASPGLVFGKNGNLTFDNLSATLYIDFTQFTLVKSISGLANAVANNSGGTYALANNIDASGKVYGAAPIQTTFAGFFDGLGHTISHLTVHDTTDTSAGLFKALDFFSEFGDLRLVQADIRDTTASAKVGGIAATASGTIFGSSVSGSVTGGDTSRVGGIAGFLYYGFIENSSASGSATGGNNSRVGGLAGYMTSDSSHPNKISGSHSGATVTGGDGSGSTYYVYVGGLVGFAEQGTIENSYATGRVTGGDNALVGGLAGVGPVEIDFSHATGKVTGGASGFIGGLVGEGGSINDDYATGDVSGGGGSSVGGLIGYGGGAERSFATGDVSGSASDVGGLIGLDSGGDILQSYATGAVSGTNSSNVGGFVGHDNEYTEFNDGSITQSYSTGAVTNDGTGFIGGFIGKDENNPAGTFANDYWDTSTSGISDASKGAGNISNDSGITGLTTAQLKSGLPAGFSGSVWKESGGINGGLPYLKNNPPN